MLRHFTIIIAVTALAGCKPVPQTYDELMTHPDELSKAMIHCQMDNFTGTNCMTIQRAQIDFTNMVNDRTIDPIGFGKKILAAQTYLGEQQVLYQKSLTPAAKQSLAAAQLKVDVMLAVLKVTFSDSL